MLEGSIKLDSGRTRRIRILGKILFVLYVIFIIYFLLFSDWYGRTGEMQEYHYNLVLFQEIKRFWQYREQLGFFAMFTNLFGNVIIFFHWLFSSDWEADTEVSLQPHFTALG